VLPSGTAKIGATEYVLATNGSPGTIAGLNNIPVMTRNGATTYLSEVAHVRDGFSPQTNVVRQNGERGVLVSVIKNGGSSTLDIQADASVKSAQDAFDIATARYRGGVDTYLEMITAQQVLLSNQRQAVQIQGQQFATAVVLGKGSRRRLEPELGPAFAPRLNGRDLGA